MIWSMQNIASKFQQLVKCQIAMASTDANAHLHRRIEHGRSSMTDWSSAQVSDWITTILTLIVTGAFREHRCRIKTLA